MHKGYLHHTRDKVAAIQQAQHAVVQMCIFMAVKLTPNLSMEFASCYRKLRSYITAVDKHLTKSLKQSLSFHTICLILFK